MTYAPTTTDQFIRDVAKRLTRLERRSDQPDRGPYELRDLIYAPPASEAARSALANQRVHWFNTATGFVESYYTTYTDAGLTVPGLQAGVTPGWYPTPGQGGPRRRVGSGGNQVRSAGQDYANWTTAVASGGLSMGGILAPSLVSATSLQVPIAGNYMVRIRISVNTGSGTMVGGVFRTTPSPAYYVQDPQVLNGTYGETQHWVLSLPLLETFALSYRVAVGSGVTVGGGAPGHFFELEYVAPLLQSA